MALTDTWTVTAWTYLALHGSYGLIWLLKDVVMPDARWQTRITFGGAFMTFALVLGLYWLRRSSWSPATPSSRCGCWPAPRSRTPWAWC